MATLAALENETKSGGKRGTMRGVRGPFRKFYSKNMKFIVQPLFMVILHKGHAGILSLLKGHKSGQQSLYHWMTLSTLPVVRDIREKYSV